VSTLDQEDLHMLKTDIAQFQASPNMLFAGADFSCVKTGPQLDPKGELRLDPQRIVDRKISLKSMVGVTGFETATPTSRT
jgi:hypothetical protein